MSSSWLMPSFGALGNVLKALAGVVKEIIS